MELVYWTIPSYSAHGQSYPRSLVSHKNSQIIIECLSSYDHVLAFSLSKPTLSHRSIAISIYNPSNLRRIADIEVMAHGERTLRVEEIVFAKDTMVVPLDCVTDTEELCTEFQVWKMNTKEPREVGIALLNTISHRNSPLSRYPYGAADLGDFIVNDRFIVIRDAEADELKVFQRNEMIRQLRLDRKRVKRIALEKGQGDLIALAFRCSSYKLVVHVYNVSRGDLVFEKECPVGYLRYMQWFGHHLVVVLEHDNVLSVKSWQLGQIGFLTCPLSVPVKISCSCPDCGGGCTSIADCLYVDYRGIVSAIRNVGYNEWDAGSQVYFQTWDSC